MTHGRPEGKARQHRQSPLHEAERAMDRPMPPVPVRSGVLLVPAPQDLKICCAGGEIL